MRRISWRDGAGGRSIELKRGHFVLAVLAAVALCPAAAAEAATFPFTGGEQTFVVPPTYKLVEIVATGASGGGPAGGTGAVVSGPLNVTPGEVLYVEVGGAGESPPGGLGGFNGGGDSSGGFGRVFGGSGGGASDVRAVSCGSPCNPLDPGSLGSRLIVAGGGGGSPGGGAAGFPGGGGSAGGGAGTQTAGGAGGCTIGGTCDSSDGSLGVGGVGVGGGGGGGLYGGGGGAGDPTILGGGGGGSSLVPSNGSLGLAPIGTPSSVVITPYRNVISLPLMGRDSGVLSFDSSNSGFTSSGSGVASLIGTFTFTNSGSVTFGDFNDPLLSLTVTGTQTLVAANGDQLTGTLSGGGTINLDTSVGSGTDVVAITGGTGRFANATGSYSFTYTNSTTSTVGTVSSGPVAATFHGNISLGVGAGAADRPTRKAHKRRHRRSFHFRPSSHRVA